MNLTGQIGELRMTLEIKRAATGETEVVELVGILGDDDGSNTQQYGTECSNGCGNGTDRSVGQA
jgi:hypothetical protein